MTKYITEYNGIQFMDKTGREKIKQYENIANEKINIKLFGAIGDGVTDDTDAFKNAIVSAYNKSLTMQSSSWKNGGTIFIPSGSYKINNTIIDESLNVSGLRFVFEGESCQKTEIYFTPTDESYLFDNQGIFGRTIFKNISFISNNKGKLMNLVGGGTGNAQSITFDNCLMTKFKTIINSTYNTSQTMGSEITFNNCKLLEFDELSILFNLGNSQGVNWRFVCTDIEVYKGIVFNYIQGQNISIYQGSMIGLNNSIFINIDSTSDSNTFGQGNSPHLNMIGSRFELRNYSKLYNCDNPEVKFDMILTSCGMGGSNKTSFTDDSSNKVYVMNNIGRGNFIFNNCSNWGNYWIHSHKIYNSNGYLSSNLAYLEFINSCPTYSTLNSNLTITEATGGSYYNIGGNPNYNFVNCSVNALLKLPTGNYKSKTGGYLYNQTPRELKRKITTLGVDENGFTVTGITSSNPAFSKTLSLPEGILLTSLKLIIESAWTGGYPSNEFDISITNNDGTFEFTKGSYVSKDGLVLTSNKIYRFKSSDKIKITWTATNNITSSYACIAHLILEY